MQLGNVQTNTLEIKEFETNDEYQRGHEDGWGVGYSDGWEELKTQINFILSNVVTEHEQLLAIMRLIK